MRDNNIISDSFLFQQIWGTISELYLSSIRDRKCISVISKFRCTSHGLTIETGRHYQDIIPKKERICLYCTKFQNNYVTECEFHFLMQCPAYNDLRNKYLQIFQIRDINSLYMILNETRNETCIKAVGLILHYAFIIGRNIIAALYCIFTCSKLIKPLLYKS